MKAIATSPQKTDAIDAALLARMLLAGLIPEAYPKSPERRELARLVRHRALLVRQRTAAECTPIGRFPTADHLVSYAGLAPITRSTGGHTRHGPIPKGANRWVRGALVSAIPSHIRGAPESELTAYYERVNQRVGWRTTRVAAARKLARIIHAMLKSGEAWRGAAL